MQLLVPPSHSPSSPQLRDVRQSDHRIVRQHSQSAGGQCKEAPHREEGTKWLARRAPRAVCTALESVELINHFGGPVCCRVSIPVERIL